MKKETEIEPIHYWTMAFYFFNLSCLSIEQLIKCENAFILISKSPMTTTQIDEATKWSDSQIGIPILFNFLHQ